MKCRLNETALFSFASGLTSAMSISVTLSCRHLLTFELDPYYKNDARMSVDQTVDAFLYGSCLLPFVKIGIKVHFINNKLFRIDGEYLYLCA